MALARGVLISRRSGVRWARCCRANLAMSSGGHLGGGRLQQGVDATFEAAEPSDGILWRRAERAMVT